ncbi:DUF6758 family protein [Nocardioides stalactiti]|uniref:DUF6758 family protein n=1 Tax=Nocardioides stalactiti TaxID=2755356 RepID=UPI00160270DD|nr:DUF6758 family protein [Nocardioides stalactiti]
MSLRVGCPRCAAPVARVPDSDGGWTCPDHGEVAALWQPTTASYDDLVAHLGHAGSFPTYLPWPLGPGWTVTDFAVVADDVGARATMTCVSGTSALDGPVDVFVVSEEPGTGLGARIAGLGPTGRADPGEEVGDGPATVKVRLGSFPVGLWPVSVSGTDGEWDRSVVVGEAEGRWLWLVLRPASAILLLRDDWILRDVSETGPQLVALPFGGPAPSW